ncbi:bifunctional 2-C-methyl-D-erythritol 4-phosphate cytidylyltransferase/2-C-methyl-D-erythritol 2,4-cyclodiphosphate synthase [Aquibaculum arenosum]|uniref:Bifunctional enzyme IspD/IspF n=1 Tax=Aquibaculum arenosum TaxID=3032591 RepID=A0ABT5YPR1_9PROT|nr:bifunctional 2-C-methyl-D-erythritol 4-phosphate cytidylyltransferase/2-C-methyl-D-erythritol 2,4-cyclodiphosphate synthase [Fodinicurvata sp. CAU 1616]MDF2096174.1 bifunctional 2-C-methyl-D-erythritol 4-phosphate cytidylyltransferase/2-C-methyl-D-erythritol 2,4-cyclodiphosphate synthase [Fodinicurvata sp. CAU 1616]
MKQTVALVVAAGRGSRFGGVAPKQYARLGQSPLLRHCLERLCHHPAVDAVRVVIHHADRAAYEAAAAGLPLLEPVEGGATRQDSVRLGLESLTEHAPQQVLIHDGARPFPATALIDRLLSALESHSGAVPALPVVDTLKQRQDSLLTSGPDRESLLRVQTPQAFHFAPILAAHRAARTSSLTDDAAVAEANGLAVAWVEGSEENFKVTTREDLQRAEQLLGQQWESRSSMGFDVHRFGPGNQVMLCGVAVPHTQGLVGHSDADVGLHALTDALLASIAAGDIGQHFPPSDPQWSGAASDSFLRHALALLHARGGQLRHVDVTLICERPKIGPYREAMRARLGGILELSPDRISIKATTTEGLGFTGRREGIEAQAIANVALPL